MFGWSRRFNWLPSNFATRPTASSGPTHITRSPTCNVKLRAANRSIPERLTRVTFTPYMLLKWSSPKVLPLILGCVIRIRRDTIGVSCFSQSTSIFGPINAMIGSASSSAQTINNWSPMWKTVSSVGMDTCPFCKIRLHTKSRPRKLDTCESVLPSKASFCISRCIRYGFMCGFSSSARAICSSSFCRFTRQM